jgi:uncharacterized membrane protein
MTIGRGWAIALGLLLVLSLAFNLFIGGLIAGARLNRPPEIAAAQMENRALWNRLSQEDRAVARDIVRERMRLNRKLGRDYRAAQREVDAALRTEPFDAARFRTALDAMRALNDRRSRDEFDGLIEAAQRFSPEGRALIAEMRRPGLRGLLPPNGQDRRDGPRDRGPEEPPPPGP